MKSNDFINELEKFLFKENCYPNKIKQEALREGDILSNVSKYNNRRNRPVDTSFDTKSTGPVIRGGY